MAEAKTLSHNEFKKSFDTLYEPLCIFANKYLNNISAAEDVVQETFIKIWEKQVEFQNKESLKSFLYTTVKNKSLDYLKTTYVKSTQALAKEEPQEWETDPFFYREVVVTEINLIIDKAIATLPEKCAEIMKLSVKGMSNPEIAEQLGISLNTIKLQKKIAYKRLRPLLKDYFVLIAFLFEIKN